MTLAVVRNIGSAGPLRTGDDIAAFEQEIVDQYALAMAAAGLTDGYVAGTRQVVFEFMGSLSGPLWSASCDDADRFLSEQRRAGRASSTRAAKANAAGPVLCVRDRPLSGRHPRVDGVGG